MKHAMTPQKEAEILRLVLQGKMLGQVASTLALSGTRVDSVARQYGWPDMDLVAQSLAALEDDTDAGVLHPIETRLSSSDDPDAPAHPDGKSFLMIPVADLQPDPDNPRNELPDIPALAESIEAQGLIQPIVARRAGSQLIVVAGHRRLAAVQLLKWEQVEVIVTRPMASDDVLAKQLIENGQRAGLDPIEEARALNRLKSQTGLNSEDLGRKIGRSPSHVAGRLRLLSLTPHDQELVRSGRMNIGEAVEKARTDSGTSQGARSHYAFHLGASHPLASRVRARCKKLHASARMVGSVGCGDCWETVIRTNERESLHAHTAETGLCALCQTPTTDTGLVDVDVATASA